MKTITDTTRAGLYEYAISYKEFDGEGADSVLAEIVSTVKGGADAVAGIVISSQRQNALQGGKSGVLEAVNGALARFANVAADATPQARQAAIAAYVAAQNTDEAKAALQAALDGDEKVQKAVSVHRESALGYVIGAPRGGAGAGPTKKQQGTLGERITSYTQEHGKPPSQAEMARIMKECGITFGE